MGRGPVDASPDAERPFTFSPERRYNAVMISADETNELTHTRGGTPRPKPKGRTGPERLILAFFELLALCVLVPLFIVLLNWANVSFDESPLRQGRAKVNARFVLAPVPWVRERPTHCLSLAAVGETTGSWLSLQGWVPAEVWAEAPVGRVVDVTWRKGRFGLSHVVAVGSEKSIDRVHLLDTRIFETLGRVWTHAPGHAPKAQ